MGKSSKWQMSVNLIANIVSFASALFISFYTTPYITKHVGMEAYGLIGLAQNFTNYVTIITASLNSMASRFIVIELHKNNNDEANKFFNSALIANTICAIVVILLSVLMIPNLENIINISKELVPDAKVTFALTFLSFSFSLATSVFGVVYYAKNRLDIGAWRTVESNIVRTFHEWLRCRGRTRIYKGNNYYFSSVWYKIYAVKLLRCLKYQIYIL